MPVFDIYSRRKRRAERGEPEVYQYDHVPHELRLQVRHILDAALGHWVPHPLGRPDLISHNEYLRSVYLQLLKEKALPRLSSQPEWRVKPIGGIDYKEEILEGVMGAFPEVDDWLDAVEICFCDIRRLANLNLMARKARGIVQDPNDAIEELNIRFRQAGFWLPV